MDSLFDILNCHNVRGKGYKSAIWRDNVDRKEKELSEFVEYLHALKLVDGTPLVETRKKTFIIGFHTAAVTIIQISKVLFQYSTVKFILSYKIGQDPTEILFGKIRSRGGWNNNPDTLAFKGALRTLLLHTEISGNPIANSIELEPTDDGLKLSLFLTRKQREGVTNSDPVDDEPHDTLIVDLDKTVTDIVEYIGTSC